MRSRDEVVKLAQSWIGKKESDGSFKSIIDIYNSFNPLPRGYKVKYTDSWCATTVSAIAIKLGYTDIIPIECSCGKMVELAKKMGIWQENDAYVPKKADFILYDWDDNGIGDNTGWPDHIGVVEKVENSIITIIEGNYCDSVMKRLIQVNGKFIRGYITPKYDIEIQNETKNVLTETKKAIELGKEIVKEVCEKYSGFDFSKYIWNECIKAGYTPIATAGLIANWYAESHLLSNNLQNSFEKKLGMSDKQYSDAVSNRTYSRYKFVNDSAGYGLAQWTYPTRKKDMYEYLIEKSHVRIDDFKKQVEFALYELKTKYSGLITKLNACKSIKEASDLVLTQYERPAVQTDKVKEERASYGEAFYSIYAK